MKILPAIKEDCPISIDFVKRMSNSLGKEWLMDNFNITYEQIESILNKENPTEEKIIENK
jgi:hypothetical protein